MPNKNGAPVPIGKVRMKENIGRAERLKEDINQYVNPRNNHHVLIYKDEKGNLKEDVVTFWAVVERKRQKQEVYQIPADGKEIVKTLQINDMFLLGLKEDEINWENPNNEDLKEHLYRVQKTSNNDYSFRFHKASTVNIKLEEMRFGIKGLVLNNAIKVKVSVSGRIEKL